MQQQQRPSLTSLIVITVAGFVGIGIVGFVILVLLSVLGPWAVLLLPVIALVVLYAAVFARRRQRGEDGSSATGG